MSGDTINIPGFVEKIKSLMSERQALKIDLESHSKNISTAEVVFGQKLDNISKSIVDNGEFSKEQCENFKSNLGFFMNELKAIKEADAKIRELDIRIAMELETALADDIVKFYRPMRYNKSRVLVKDTDMFIVNEKSGNGYVEITPDELWCLHIAKLVIDGDNIDFKIARTVSKEDYYGGN